MSQKRTHILMIFVLLIFNGFICLSAKHVYFSDPDLTNPNIPIELRDSCGYKYGVRHYTIKYPKLCFGKSYADRNITIAFNGVIDKVKWAYETPEPTDRILGGSDVKYREAPWVVQITRRGSGDRQDYFYHWCTGVLITMRHILTVAHCGINFTQNSLRIYAGNDNTAQGWTTTHLTFHSHPNYSTVSPQTGEKPNNNYDIAIIKLNKPLIDWNKEGKDENGMYLTNTICLPLKENFSDPKFDKKYYTYRNATAFGWGLIREYERPLILQRGDYPLRYESDVKFISLAETNETRSCHGDSGSGVVQYLDEYQTRAVLIGIHSQSNPKTKKEENPPCNLEHLGESYDLRVVHFMKWINETLQQN